MLKISNPEVYGWEAAIRGMRNPLNSWDKSDSLFFVNSEGHVCKVNQGETTLDSIELGSNDYNLMKRLLNAGSDHSKFMRMITVTMDITAPLYWWKEFDTYKVGTVANSCSTMHTIHKKPFELDDFSHENLCNLWALKIVIEELNRFREIYNKDGSKDIWYSMIQLLPSSYNQKRTVQLNYAVLRNIYYSRRNHKLDEWHTFCDFIRSLPYYELITGGENNV